MKSDGCTLFTDGNYLSCCEDHDNAYACGGMAEQRKAADRCLRECVAACGRPIVARLMYAGMRVVGASHFWPWFNWGTRTPRTEDDDMNSTAIWKAVAIIACAMFFFSWLAGCAQIDAYQAAVAHVAAKAADDALESAEWYVCKGASVGAVRRRHGPKPGIYRDFCNDAMGADLISAE